MATPILATKLYVPPPRRNVVLRSRLIERLNEGLALGRRLSLISAPAGFGKTTLVGEWVAGPWRAAPGQVCERLEPKVRVAWLSLDEGDNDPARFLAYLVAALQNVAGHIGEGVLGLLEAPPLPPIEATLTTLLNDITAIPDHFVLVLDDYHVIDSRPLDDALTFLLEHLPPQMHLVIATREDPHLSVARLRARGQMTELRAADLRFTPSETADFLNQVMGLNLSAEDIAALEIRTEGWIAGLQLAAISMQGRQDTADFILSFTGSHHFVLDYLLEEVLHRQPTGVQTFLLRTSILDRMCGPLCDAVLHGDVCCHPQDYDRNSADTDRHPTPSSSGQETLEYLEHANLFIVPLDNERRWYRYHHLFAELLRQRLGQSLSSAELSELHIQASEWYEHNGLALEAFQHAAVANDVERAERLIESKEMNLHLLSVVRPILDWLASLPKTVLDAKPRLWVRSATLALMAGQTTGVEEKLQAAEQALHGVEPDQNIRDLIGQMACARATLALTHYDPEAMVIQAQRALGYLHPENLTFRFTAHWALASAYRWQGDRSAAARACQESLAISQKARGMFSKILSISTLGELLELDNQLYQAAETYRQVLDLAGEHPQPSVEGVHLGLARICYEWNDLDAAETHGQQSLQLARLYDHVIDRFIVSQVFLARLKLARGDVGDAAAMLAQAEQSAHQKNFTLRLPDIAAIQVLALIRQGQVAAAAQLARQYELPLSQARVLIAQNDPSAALQILEPLRQQAEARGWADQRLQTMVLQAVAQYMRGEKEKAGHVVGEALTLAEPGGFIRLFVDEGEPMRLMISDFRSKIENRALADYVCRLLAAFPVARSQVRDPKSETLAPHARAGVLDQKSRLCSAKRTRDLRSEIVEPLSQRELQVLRLIASGLSNDEIGGRLFLALDTVKGHNRRIFDKLQVQRRTEAAARAHELGLV